MSVQALTWAFEQRVLQDPIDCLVLICLSNYASDRGALAWCGVPTMARMTKLHERRVQRTLRRLEAQGVIERQDSKLAAFAEIGRWDKCPTVYRLRLDRMERLEGSERLPARASESDDFPPDPLETESPRGDTGDTPLGAPLLTTGCQIDPHGVTKTGVRGDTAVSPKPKATNSNQKEVADEPPPPAAGILNNEKSQARGLTVSPRSADPSAPWKSNLADWVAREKSEGRAPIPEGDPVFAYADAIGLGDGFLKLAWKEFHHRFTQEKAQQRERDWRGLFAKAVRENWFRLWAPQDGGGWRLTPQGVQARLFHRVEVH